MYFFVYIHVGADVILDFVGASYWENHTQCVAVDGRIVVLGLVCNLQLRIPSVDYMHLNRLGKMDVHNKQYIGG